MSFSGKIPQYSSLALLTALLMAAPGAAAASDLPTAYARAFMNACLEQSGEALCKCLLDGIQAEYRITDLTESPSSLDGSPALALRDACIEAASSLPEEPDPAELFNTRALELSAGLETGGVDALTEASGSVGWVLVLPAEKEGDEPRRFAVGLKTPLPDEQVQALSGILGGLQDHPERWSVDAVQHRVTLEGDGAALRLSFVADEGKWFLREVAWVALKP